ncbi:calcium-binding protein [Cyanobacteria bacterium FACHB-502]|nr:calcium-binding protein [Cyanobacteria bacterium FACHB-502]
MVNIRGTAGNDNLIGTSDDDVLTGLEGDDILNGLTGADFLFGGDGNDALILGYVPGDESDTVNGGQGIDSLTFDWSTANAATGIGSGIDGSGKYVYGTPDQRITAISIERFIVTGTIRNDELFGGTGDDIFRGGEGNDRFIPNGGVNTLIGGSGKDSVVINFSLTTLGQTVTNVGTSGLTNGTTFTEIEAFTLTTGSGNDIITLTGDYDDTISTTAGDDIVSTNGGNDRVNGGAGNDRLDAGAGDDVVEGDIGDDVLNSGTGADQIFAGDGNDALIVGYAPGDEGDIVVGGQGIDSLTFDWSASNDATGIGSGIDAIGRYNYGIPDQGIRADSIERFIVTGTSKDDGFQGGTDADILRGGNGNDTFTSRSGDDQLIGGRGNDRFFAGEGNDTLHGDIGKDTLEGGSGQDFFIFDIGKAFNRSIGVDTIVDFERFDKIVLDKTTFKGIKGQRASFASVGSISQAQKSAALVVYVRPTGGLFYNQNQADDGFGTGKQFANLADGFKFVRSNLAVQV